MERKHFDDLTKIDVPLGLLDDDTCNRLRAHNGLIEHFSHRGVWVCNECPSFTWSVAYRAKPQPLTKPQVPDELWRAFPDWVKGVAKNGYGRIVLLSSGAHPSDVGEHWIAGSCARLKDWNIDPGTCDWRDSLVKRPEGL